MGENVKEIRYHPKNKPIPEGWRVVSELEDTNHGEYSVLIERVVDAV